MSYWFTLILYTSCIFSISNTFKYSELLSFSYNYNSNDYLKESIYSQSNNNNGSSILQSLITHGHFLDNIKSTLYDHTISNESVSKVVDYINDYTSVDAISPQCVKDAAFALMQLQNRQQWTYSS